MILKREKQRNKPVLTEQVLRLPYPPTANTLFANAKAGGGRFKSKKYKAWIDEAGWTLREQRPVEMIGAVEIEIVAVKPDKRKRDLANLEKAILDLLVAHRVIEDDSCVQCFAMSWGSSDLGGVSVTISAYDKDAPERGDQSKLKKAVK